MREPPLTQLRMERVAGVVAVTLAAFLLCVLGRWF